MMGSLAFLLAFSSCGCGSVAHNKKDLDVDTVTSMSSGTETNKDVEKRNSVEKGKSVKKRIPYDQVEDLGCLYLWYDEEDKSLLDSYTILEDYINKKDYYYEDTKSKILSTYFSFPEVNKALMPKLSKVLDKERKKQKKAFDKTVKEALGYANEMVNSIEGLNKDKIDVNPYVYEVSWLPIRNDKNILTIVSERYSDFGGAHPNSEKVVLSYNPNTGEKLSIKSIAKNEKNFHKVIEQKLFDYIEDNKCQEYLFEKDTYAEEFKKWDQDWWILNGYLFIGFNTYDIAPYAAGPIVIPIDLTDSKELLNDYGRSLIE